MIVYIEKGLSNLTTQEPLLVIVDSEPELRALATLVKAKLPENGGNLPLALLAVERLVQRTALNSARTVASLCDLTAMERLES